jgi:hypothetical protein
LNILCSIYSNFNLSIHHYKWKYGATLGRARI